VSNALRDAREVQRAYFEAANERQFRWLTASPGIREAEEALLAPWLATAEAPCLEIGCGEGGNLLRLGRKAACFGVDRFPRKLAFAARALPSDRLAVADAVALPFADGRFATVFVRDLLHHLPEPEAALREAVRVLRPGGALLLLEPNGRNPLIQLQSRLIRAEAGALRFRPELVAGWLAALPLVDVRVESREPLLLRRLVLHYRFGLPALARAAPLLRLLVAAETALGRLLAPSRWSYVSARARRAPV
jgi:SAM-dependent methyltransferase